MASLGPQSVLHFDLQRIGQFAQIPLDKRLGHSHNPMQSDGGWHAQARSGKARLIGCQRHIANLRYFRQTACDERNQDMPIPTHRFGQAKRRPNLGGGKIVERKRHQHNAILSDMMRPSVRFGV